MNILVFSESAWDDTNSLGNTLSNFFDGNIWENDNFYHIYLRNARPNNKICTNYYRMTMFDMAKHYFNKEKIGIEFDYSLKNENNDFSKKEKKEQRYINFLHRHSLKFIYSLIDFLFRQKKWINSNFKKYINKVNPDIVFLFVTSASIFSPFAEYVKKNTTAKIITFIADDIYGSYKHKFIFNRNKLRKELSSIISFSDKVYAISNELCNEYKTLFNKEINILYKGCNFDFPIKANINNQLKFVYAGNLLYGRDEILSLIARAIQKSNNKNNQKAFLEIYTNSPITDELKNKLNIKNSSLIIGKRKYNEIIQIMHNADFNLHVESFEMKQIDKVKYSFSTKIVDCLQSGSLLVGIGPLSISSIKYIKKIPGACVIDNVENINNQIETLILNKHEILLNVNKIRNYAIKYHDRKKIQEKLKNDFINLQKN